MSLMKHLSLSMRAALFQLLIAIVAFMPMLAMQPAHATDTTDYGENKTIDFLMRGQTFPFGAQTATWSAAPSHCFALYTVAPTDSTAGTEATGGSYARQCVTGSLVNFAGTQSAGSTTASIGTGGTTSNNNAITFPTATASWGTIVAVCDTDASTAGNRIWCTALTTSKAVGTGDTPSFAAGALTFQIDN